MAVCPETIDEWLLHVPNLLEDEGWQIGHESPAGKLWKQSCPWGGHLVRLSCHWVLEYHTLMRSWGYLFLKGTLNPEP